VTAEPSLPALSRPRSLSFYFLPPRPAEEESDRAALVSTWSPARVNPPKLLEQKEEPKLWVFAHKDINSYSKPWVPTSYSKLARHQLPRRADFETSETVLQTSPGHYEVKDDGSISTVLLLPVPAQELA